MVELFTLLRGLKLIKRGGGTGPVKPGNLLKSGANTVSELKLDDERENSYIIFLVVYSLEFFRRVYFFVEEDKDGRQLHIFVRVSNRRTPR